MVTYVSVYAVYGGVIRIKPKFQVVFWAVMPHTVVVGYQQFRGPCCLHLQGEVDRMGENSIDVSPNWRGVMGATSQ